MKKIKKVNLKLEKEVISHLTPDHLSKVAGGAESNYATCLQITQNKACIHTMADKCTIEVASANGNTCLCLSDVCKPIQPPKESYQYVCVFTKNC